MPRTAETEGFKVECLYLYCRGWVGTEAVVILVQPHDDSCEGPKGLPPILHRGNKCRRIDLPNHTELNVQTGPGF